MTTTRCPICTEYPDDKSWHRSPELGRDTQGHHPDCPFWTRDVGKMYEEAMEELDGQPCEMEEWLSYDPDC